MYSGMPPIHSGGIVDSKVAAVVANDDKDNIVTSYVIYLASIYSLSVANYNF